MKKVLIIDDQEDILEVLCFYIEGSFNNVEVIEASNGNDAVEVLKNEDIDSIICDYRMPGGNGDIVFEFNLSQTQIPFAWHSATFSVDCTNLKGKEGSDYVVLSKPVDEEDLIQAVRSMLELNDHQIKYFKVKSSIVRSLRNEKLDIYTKVGQKFILLDHDGLSCQRIEQYEIRGLTHFYLKEEEFKKVGNSLIQNLHQQLEECGSLEDVYFVASDIVESFGTHLMNTGIEFDKIKLANSCAQKCLASLNKSRDIKKLMVGVIDQTNYVSSHSLLTIQLASLVCDQEEILSKIANAAILHDLAVKNERLAKASVNSDGFDDLSPAEKKVVIEHGDIVVSKLKGLQFDEDVKKLISSHHIDNQAEERDLFLIFSIAHEIADFICLEGLDSVNSKVLAMKNSSINSKRNEYLARFSSFL